MAADYQVTFNGFAYDGTTGVHAEELDIEHPYKVRTAETPGRPEKYVAPALAACVKITISGMITGSSRDDLRTKIDAFLAAHAPGPRAALYIDSDRYRLAQVTGVGKLRRSPNMIGATLFSVTFEAATTETTVP